MKYTEDKQEVQGKASWHGEEPKDLRTYFKLTSSV